MKRQILCTALVVTACSGRAGELRPAGSERGPCYGNDTCDAGLSCSGSGLCVVPGPATHEGCGDGVVNPDETCDDANLEEGDGCSATCLVEDQGPGGDSCVTAKRLRLVPVAQHSMGAFATGDTTGGTDTLGCSCNCVGPDHVYVVAVPEGGTLAAVMSPEADFDPAIHLRGPDACVDVAAEVDCGERTGSGEPEQVTAVSAAAGDYYLIPDGWAGTNGAYTLQVMVRELNADPP